MNQVLYRRFRPQAFAEVIGQEHVVKTLSHQLSEGRLGHAYLFTGPRGVGKTSIARILARAANCLKPSGAEPDNSCDVCRAMINGSSLDFVEIDAASHTGVDNIREIIEHLNLPPTQAKYRVYVIDEVHMLSRGAFNAILKTLEEPPSHVLFILATTEAHKVPATVISRTQRFDFRRLTDAQISRQLELVSDKSGLKFSREVIEAIGQSVDGSLRDALVMLEKAAYLAQGENDSADIIRLLGITPMKMRSEFLALVQEGELAKTSAYLQKAVTQGYSMEQFSKDFLEYLRNLMVEQADPGLATIADNFLSAHGLIKVSPVPELPLMVAAVKSAVKPENSRSVNKQTGGGNGSNNNGLTDRTQQAASLNSGQAEHVEVADIETKWQDILARVKNYNQSLLTALKLAEPVGTVNGSLTIGFPYKFHADTVNAPKNRLVIERVLEELFGRRIVVKCVMLREQPQESRSKNHESPNGQAGKDNLLKSAMDILGGEVIE